MTPVLGGYLIGPSSPALNRVYGLKEDSLKKYYGKSGLSCSHVPFPSSLIASRQLQEAREFGRIGWENGNRGQIWRSRKRERRRFAVVCCDGRPVQRAKKAVIVGAGPAGAMLALLLARQNWKVDVYECKQWLEGYWAPGQPDGWSVMLGSRAAHCLEQVGLKEEVWAEGVVCTGRTSITGISHGAGF